VAQTLNLGPTPTIDVFTPTTGAAPGAKITVTGANLNRDTLGRTWTTSATPPYLIVFAGANGPVPGAGLRFISSTTLQVTVPEGAVTGQLRLVKGSYSRATRRAFPVLPRPTLSGPAGQGTVGALVTLRGTDLNRNADGRTSSGAPSYRIQFSTASGFIDATFTVQSSTLISARVPSGAVTGPVRLISGVYKRQATGTFTVLPTLPRLTSVEPAFVARGATVTVRGTNLDHNGDGTLWSGAPQYRIQFQTTDGFSESASTFVNSGQLSAVVPVNAVPGFIRLTDGSHGSAINYSVAIPPRLTGFTPASGAAGAQVTIAGSFLDRDSSGLPWSGQPPYLIQFAGASGFVNAPFSVTSANSITAIVPVGAVTGVVRLVQPGFIQTTPVLFTVINPPPTPTTFRLQNFSQLLILNVRFNGVTAPRPPTLAVPGEQIDFPSANGQAAFINDLEVDLGTTDGVNEEVWFTTRFAGINIPVGQITTRIIGRITVPQMLTNGQVQSTFSGSFFDDNGAFHLAAFVFRSNGTWTFFVDNVQQATGVISEISWPNFSPRVLFGLGNGLNAEIFKPFGSFLLRNGPPSFPVIQYTRQ